MTSHNILGCSTKLVDQALTPNILGVPTKVGILGVPNEVGKPSSEPQFLGGTNGVGGTKL